MEHLRSLKCIPAKVHDRPKYWGDFIILHYRPLGFAVLSGDLAMSPDTTEFEVVGGIGRYVFRADGNDTWEPATTHTPLPTSPDVVAARLAAFQSCDSYRDSRWSVAGCGCSGQGFAERAYRQCPRDLWPLHSQLT